VFCKKILLCKLNNNTQHKYPTEPSVTAQSSLVSHIVLWSRQGTTTCIVQYCS